MRMKHWTLLLLYLGTLLGAAIIGCKPANTMVGTWEMQIDPQVLKQFGAENNPPKASMTFKEDGTFAATFSSGSATQTGEGTYVLKERELTMTATKTNGKAAQNATPQTVTLSEDMKSFEVPGSNGMGKFVKK